MSQINPQASLAVIPTTARPSAWKWGAGVLGLAVAAGAGALVMRGVDHAPAPSSASTSITTEVASGGVVAPPAAKPGASPHRNDHAGRNVVSGTVSGEERPVPTAPVAVCAACGVVESIHAMQEKGAGTGLGAVAGGLLGGVVGHQMGGGNGRTAMTVLGAVGGGLAGNEVEKRARAETVFEVKVRMEDGSMRTFHRSQSLPVGAEVVADGSTLRVKREAAPVETPHTLRTSTGNV